MTISTRHPVVKNLCRSNLHSLGVFMSLINTSVQDYADALWSIRPEDKGGPG